MIGQPPRRWFRFSLRTLFVVMTLLGCWLGWESSVVRRRQAVRSELAANSAFQFVSAEDYAKRFPAGTPRVNPASIPAMRRWLGDEAIQQIVFLRYYQGFSETELERVTNVFPEAEPIESLPEPCHPGCFPRGTLVETPSGRRPIESIRQGEALTIVLTSGELATARVQSVFVTENRLLKVLTAESELLTTATQPLCLALGRIAPAGQLQPTDNILCLHNGAIRSLPVLEVSPTGRTEKVFNLVLGNSEVFIAGSFLARSKPPASE